MTPLQKRCQHLLDMGDLFRAAVAGIAIERQDESGWCEVCSSESPYFEQGFAYRIKPEPKYRPFTPEEALKHVGREFTSSGAMAPDYVFRVRAVRPGDVLVSLCRPSQGDEHHLSLEMFAELGTFVDDGSPCGVLTSPKNGESE